MAVERPEQASDQRSVCSDPDPGRWHTLLAVPRLTLLLQQPRQPLLAASQQRFLAKLPQAKVLPALLHATDIFSSSHQMLFLLCASAAGIQCHCTDGYSNMPSMVGAITKGSL